MKIHQSKISLFFFFIVATIGTLLRSTSFIHIPLEFRNLIHSHSHVAFQGWIYTLLFLLLTRLFLSKYQIKKGRYSLQFQLTIVVIIGILISFSWQGYALYSIIFSTVFQILNYWFIYRFFKDTKQYSKKNIALKFVKTGLWLGILSSLAPYGIGILSAKGFNGSEAYHSLVYTFLHLQYNGWFLFVALGLLFQLLESNAISFCYKSALKFYWLFTVAVIPAIALSLLGMSFSKYIIIPAYFSVGLQYLGLFYFIRIFYSKIRVFTSTKNKLFQLFFIAFFISFLLKVVVQGLSVLPVFKSFAFENKFIILAYLHLNFIGVLSFLLLSFIVEQKWLLNQLLTRIGGVLLFVGYISTEILLLLGGLGWFYSILLIFIGSLAMAIGVLLLLFNK